MLSPTLEELGYELEKTAKQRDALVQALEECVRRADAGWYMPRKDIDKARAALAQAKESK